MPIESRTQVLPDNDRDVNIWGAVGGALINPFLTAGTQMLTDWINPDPNRDLVRAQADQFKLQNKQTQLGYLQEVYAGEKSGAYEPGSTKAMADWYGVELPEDSLLGANELNRANFAEMNLARGFMENGPRLGERPGNPNDQISPPQFLQAPGPEQGPNPFIPEQDPMAGAFPSPGMGVAGLTPSNPFVSGGGADFLPPTVPISQPEPIYLETDAIDPAAQAAGEQLQQREGAFVPPNTTPTYDLSTGQLIPPDLTPTVNPNTQAGKNLLTGMAQDSLAESRRKAIADGSKVPGHPNFTPAKNVKEWETLVFPKPRPQDQPMLDSIEAGNGLTDDQKAQQMKDAAMVGHYAEMVRRISKGESTAGMLEMMGSYAYQGKQAFLAQYNRAITQNKEFQDSILSQYMGNDAPGAFVAYGLALAGDQRPEIVEQAQKWTNLIKEVPPEMAGAFMQKVMASTGAKWTDLVSILDAGTQRYAAEQTADIARLNVGISQQGQNTQDRVATAQIGMLEAQSRGVRIANERDLSKFNDDVAINHQQLNTLITQQKIMLSEDNRAKLASLITQEQWRMQQEMAPIDAQLKSADQTVKTGAYYLSAIQSLDGQIQGIQEQIASSLDDKTKAALTKSLTPYLTQRKALMELVNQINAQVLEKTSVDLLSQVRSAVENSGMERDELAKSFGLSVMDGNYYMYGQDGQIRVKPYRDAKGNMLHPKMVNISSTIGYRYFEQNLGDGAKFMTPEEFAVLPVPTQDGAVRRLKDIVGPGSQLYALYNIANNEWKKYALDPAYVQQRVDDINTGAAGELGVPIQAVQGIFNPGRPSPPVQEQGQEEAMPSQRGYVY